jgi:serine/threonine-protein kinase RsbW
MKSGHTLTVPGTDAGLRQAIAALESWLGGAGLSTEARHRLMTVLDEVLSNIVRHGFAATAGDIAITTGQSNGRVSVAIADNAPPFNPLTLAPPDVTLSLEKRRPGGLGVALIRALSDDATYARSGGRNVLTLYWRLDPGPQDPPHGHS